MVAIILYNILLIYLLYKSDKKKKIYYNNYIQCLRALSEQDPGLADYLRR